MNPIELLLRQKERKSQNHFIIGTTTGVNYVNFIKIGVRYLLIFSFINFH